jgi:hypothetical protein
VSGAAPIALTAPVPAPRRSLPPLDSVPRPRGRDLAGTELEQFVRELADRPELWIERVRHDATQRVYEELHSDDT